MLEHMRMLRRLYRRAIRLPSLRLPEEVILERLIKWVGLQLWLLKLQRLSLRLLLLCLCQAVTLKQCKGVVACIWTRLTRGSSRACACCTRHWWLLLLLLQLRQRH